MISDIRALFAFAKPKIGYLIISFVATLVYVAGSLVAPLLIGDAINCMVGVDNVDHHAINGILVKLVAILSAAVVGRWASEYTAAKACYEYGYELRRKLFEHFMRMPVSELDSRKKGDMLQRITGDVTKISFGYLQGLRQLQNGLLTIIGTLIIMILIDYRLAIILFLLTPLSLFVSWFIGKYMRGSYTAQARLNGEIYAYTEEKINGYVTLKTTGRLKDTAQDFENINQELYHHGFNAQFASALTNPCTRFVNAVIHATICLVGALLIVRGNATLLGGALSIGTLSAALSYANQYTKPFNEITGILNELYAASASCERVAALLQIPVEAERDEVRLTPEDDIVSFEDVSFCYDPAKPLIEHFDFVADRGCKIAIVGPTGCGKTTLINLIMRFYDPRSGHICMNGKRIQDATRANVRDMYGMVLQDSWIMTGSVRDNIAFFNKDATIEDIRGASVECGANEFIEKLPEGYDTILSESSALSEGQKQLLCIARVILDKPPMLLLDEATASIDTRTELKLTRAFDALMAGRTCFVVAHRLSTILDADTILVMKDGRIIEQGDHRTLLANDGFYAKLYKSQY